MEKVKDRKFFKEAYELIKPYWVSDQKWKAVGLLIICLAATFGFVYMTVIINEWSGHFYTSLQELNKNKFMEQVFLFFPLATAFVLFYISKNYFIALLGFTWRMWLTNKYVQDWTKKDVYYHVMNEKVHVDNPDQRISEDLSYLPSYTVGLFIAFIEEITNLIAFGIILWNLSKMVTFNFFGLDLHIPGYLIWAAFLYAAFGSGIIILIGRPLIKLSFIKEKFEANFRYSLIRLQERKDEIALYEGSFAEGKNLLEKFDDIRMNFYQIIKTKIYINLCQNFYINLANLLPIVVASPMYFAGAITLGNLIQIRMAFDKVKDSFSIIVDNFTTIASWRASILRLTELKENIRHAHYVMDNNKINLKESHKDKLTVKDLKILKPTGELLKSDINFELEPKDRLLIKGPSGSGKSTVIKSIKGIWKYGSGKIQFPVDKKIAFIPQRPYMPVDTLLNVIFYPQHDPDKETENNIAHYMQKFNLTHLISSLNEKKDWINTLSLGEQQRIAAIRALINNPDILVLDEPTTSLDKESEENVFKEFLEKFKSKIIICVSHSEKFSKFFNKKLEF
jgi:putative ATP-binding cassette transporter